MGESVARNMQGWFKNINKRNLLYLVGGLHRCSGDARSHKHQVVYRSSSNTLSKEMIGNRLISRDTYGERTSVFSPTAIITASGPLSKRT
jgi:hypothetical protein